MAEQFYFTHRKNTVDLECIDVQCSAAKQRAGLMQALHDTLREQGQIPLEVSAKSDVELGRKLSTAKLKLGNCHIENVFQASKVFAFGGPYLDLLGLSSKAAKQDPRLKTSGKLVSFRSNGFEWALEHETIFYDWLHYCAIRENLTAAELDQLISHTAFTNIEFDPKAPVNTPARSVALVAALYTLLGSLPALKPNEFIQIHNNILSKQK